MAENPYWEDEDWNTPGAPVTNPPAAPARDLEAEARALYGSRWDADAAQQFAYRQSVGQTPEQILANTTGDINARFPTQTGPSAASGTFSFASPSVGGAPQSIQPYGEKFSFDTSKLGESQGFKFRFDKAMEAIQRARAAKGTLFSPQTWKAMQEEASGLASDELGAEFERQGETYDRNFTTHAWNEGNRFSSQRTNRMDDFSISDADRRFGFDTSQFARGNFERDRAFDYGRERDRMDDTWRFIDYGYGAARR